MHTHVLSFIAPWLTLNDDTPCTFLAGSLSGVMTTSTGAT